MPKLQKLRPQRDAVPMLYRAASIDRAGRPDDQARSLPIVLASETPVQVYDLGRGEIVDEVIEMAGVDLPRQVPLLDSHDRSSVRHVLGSIRELRVEGSELKGTAYFASHPDAQRAYEQYRDGHLTDFSIGAVSERVDWRDGVKRITKSRPLEGSAVVVGADPTATVEGALRCYMDPHGVREMAITEQLRRDFDVPDDVSDSAVVDWIKNNVQRQESAAVEEESALTAAEEMESPQQEGTDMAEQVNTAAADEQRAADRAAEVQRVTSINEFADRNNWPVSLRNQAIANEWSTDRCATEELQRRADAQVSQDPVGLSVDRIEMGESSVDKFARAALDGFRQRAFAGSRFDALRAQANQFRAYGLADAVDDVERSFKSPAQGASDFRYASFYDLSRAYLEQYGERNLAGLPKHEVIRRAIRRGDELVRSGAYHTTGSFSNLLLDASNKTLLMAYLEAPSTWQIWARQAPSASDFKTINRIRFGELPNPEMVPENGKYPDKAVADAKESYSVDKYGEIFSVTLEAMVNDDLDGMSRLPAMHGAAMRRKVNASVYQVLTDNAALSDGTALFAAGHGNTDTNALSTSALNTGFTKMMVQTGVSSDAILNIAPRFLITCPAVASTALTIINSSADPTSTSNTADFNEGTVNLYGPQGPRTLVPVIDAYLSSSTAATTWFLAADTSQVDTVEVSFLQGEETPILEREDGFDVDAVRFKCRQTWGTKAIDYRGLYRGNT